MKLRTLCLTLIALCLTVAPAVAQVDLYDNGAIDGNNDAWTFNFGFVPSDRFTTTQNATVTELQFGAWLTPGDVLESVEVVVSSEEYGGTTYTDQVANVTQSGCSMNQFGFNVCLESASLTGFNLNAGTYWLNLENGVVNTGDPVYWDENDGPSAASEGSLGTIPSESFTILGAGSTTGTTGTTPEPSSIMLFGSGILGLTGILRRKF